MVPLWHRNRQQIWPGPFYTGFLLIGSGEKETGWTFLIICRFSRHTRDRLSHKSHEKVNLTQYVTFKVSLLRNISDLDRVTLHSDFITNAGQWYFNQTLFKQLFSYSVALLSLIATPLEFVHSFIGCKRTFNHISEKVQNLNGYRTWRWLWQMVANIFFLFLVSLLVRAATEL